MLGLIVLGVFALYLLLSLGVVLGTYRIAKGRGLPPKRAWRVAGIAGLIMYLLLFWDWLPTVAAKQYYCRTQGGLVVTKTLDQWKAENPGVAETLTWKSSPDKGDSTYDPATGSQTYILNQRFLREIQIRKLPLLGVKVVENRLSDRKTNEVLAHHVDVVTGYGNPMVGGDWRALKDWLRLSSCDGSGRPSLRRFDDMSAAAKRMGSQQ